MARQRAEARTVLLTLAILAWPVVRCEAQAVRQTTVQLPTFEQFGTSTTVIVPDRGTTYLGGVTRSSLGQNSYGVPFGGHGLGNRGIGRASSTGTISITATIIDHDAMDRALLAEAARRRGAKFDVLGRPIDTQKPSHQLSRNRFRQSSSEHNTAQVSRGGVTTDPKLAVTYMSRGRRAEAKGQPNMAKVFYRRALKHGDSSLKEQARARLDYLETIAPTSTPTDSKPAS